MGNVLVLFSFTWMIVAALIGIALAKLHEGTLARLGQIAEAGDLAKYHRAIDVYQRRKLVHAHAFLFSLVAGMVGLAMNRMSYSVATLQVLGIALIASTVLWTAGGLRWNRPLMIMGDLCLLASIVAAAVGMAKGL